MNNIQKSGQILIGISTFLTLIASMISDILIPIAPLALYLGICMLIMTIVTLILYAIPRTRNFMSKITNLWFIPIFITLNISYIILFTTFYYSDKSEGQRGVLAENTDIIKSIQEHLHIIATNTKEVKESLTSVDVKMDNVKKETSTDPRKELANRGVEWSVNGYNNVLNLRDISSIKLFISSGIDVFATENDNEIPKILNIIAEQKYGYKDIFELAIKNGLDIDKKIPTINALKTKLKKISPMMDMYIMTMHNELPTYFSALEYLCFLPNDFSDEYIDMLMRNNIDANICVDVRNKYIINISHLILKDVIAKIEDINKTKDFIEQFTKEKDSYKDSYANTYKSLLKILEMYIDKEKDIVIKLKNTIRNNY